MTLPTHAWVRKLTGAVPAPFRPIGVFLTKSPDVPVYILFLVLALALQLIAWQGVSPYLLLGGDTANVASFVAGWWHPERFLNDGVLNDPKFFRFYFTLHIPLAHALATLVGDIGTAFLVLLAPHVLVYLVGWYMLGTTVLHDRGWALAFVVANFVYFPTMEGDYWGLMWQVQPRMTFQALLPFTLVLGLATIERSRLQLPLFICAGALVYAHPVSAPIVALAFLTAVAVTRSRGTLKARVAESLMNVFAVATVAVPFAVIFFSDTIESGAEHVTRLAATLPRTIYDDVGVALSSYAKNPSFVLISVGGFLAAGLVTKYASQDRKQLTFLACWLGALIAFTVGVPALEQLVSNHRGVRPSHMDLIRNLRYSIPLEILFVAIAAKMAWSNWRFDAGAWSGRFVIIVCVIALALWTAVYHVAFPLRSFASCLGSGSILCPPVNAQVKKDLLAVVSRLPPAAPVLPVVGRNESDIGLMIRYSLLHPVTMTEKDVNNLGYTKSAKLPLFEAQLARMFDVIQIEEETKRSAEAVLLGRDLGARYVVLMEHVRWHPAGTRMVSATPSFSVIDVCPSVESCAGK